MMALPNAKDTDDVINKKVLQKLNNSAMLINVGRGNSINEQDLADALNSGELAAAALDTTKIEPLDASRIYGKQKIASYPRMIRHILF